MFELDNIKNQAILRDFFIFKVDNIKNEAILRDVLQKWNVECRADGLVLMCFAIFWVHVSKLLRPTKKWCQVIRSAAPVTQNHLIWGSKMQSVSGNQRPDLLTALRLPRKMHLCRSSSNVAACHRFWKCYKTLTFCSLLTRCTIPCACHAKRHLNVQKWSEPRVLLTFWLRNVLRATTACTFSTSQLPKVVRGWCVLCILTSTCASRHNGVHFLDSSTSKRAPNVRYF